jgi:hypothetical protein
MYINNITFVMDYADGNNYIENIEFINSSGDVAVTYPAVVETIGNVTLTSGAMTGNLTALNTSFRLRIYFVGNGTKSARIGQIYGFYKNYTVKPADVNYTYTNCFNSTHVQKLNIYQVAGVNQTINQNLTSCAYGCSLGACSIPTTVFKFSGLLTIALAIVTVFSYLFIRTTSEQWLKYLFLCLGLTTLSGVMYQVAVTGVGWNTLISSISNPLLKVGIAISWIFVLIMLWLFLNNIIETVSKSFGGKK